MKKRISAKQRLARAANQLAEARRELAYFDESAPRQDRTQAITKIAQIQADIASAIHLLPL